MIRQRDVDRYKFYTTDGTDIWRIKKVSTFTLVELVNCETGGTASARVGEKSAGGFTAVKMPKLKATGHKPQATKQKGKGKRDKGQRKRQKAKESIRKSSQGVRKGKTPTSKYPGVCIDKRAMLKKYRAQVQRSGKYTYLGAFACEEDAAAAVQEHLGNTEEAARLRGIVEKKTEARSMIDKFLNKDKWMCHGCGAIYDEKPDQCTHCGSGAFEKSRNEGNHK